MSRLEFLFDRYRNGRCTQDEELELIQLLDQPNDPDVARLLQALWHDSPVKLPHKKGRDMLEAILGNPARVVPIRQKSYMWTRVAAAVAGLMVLGVALYQVPSTPQSSQAVTQAPEVAQHQMIRLPDGSTVILNKASTLDYAPSFADKKTRDVYLTGEAFFDIRHDASKVFIVHTGKIQTAVLGTSFNVKAYPDQDDIVVTVTRGQVSVSDEERVLGILAPDDQITFSKHTQQARLAEVNSQAVITWTEKDYVFDDVSMLEAAEQLEERFHVTITFKNDPIKDCRFTASFIGGENVLDILDVICEFNQAAYVVNASGEIEISGSGCSPGKQ